MEVKKDDEMEDWDVREIDGERGMKKKKRRKKQVNEI
jgi:hypothetical protein